MSCGWCHRPADAPGANAAGVPCPCWCHGERHRTNALAELAAAVERAGAPYPHYVQAGGFSERDDWEHMAPIRGGAPS